MASGLAARRYRQSAPLDAQGNAASVLQSNYFDGGSGGVAGDTGIFWHNRRAAFSAQPGHPDTFAPGKLPDQALRGPRFLLGRTFPDRRDRLKLETDAGPAVAELLAQRGRELAALPPLGPLAGHAGVIAITHDNVVAAHDPRGEGVGAVLP